jgi:ribosomal protein S18 acetylase RimI-like enzyme
MGTPTQAQIRWVIRRDIDTVLAIDRQAFGREECWEEEEWVQRLGKRNQIGLLSETDFDIHGVMLYSLHKGLLVIERLVVRNADRRKGYGSQMVQRLLDRLHIQKRHSVETIVPEHMVGAQLFFASLGFVAVACERDGLRMVWSLEPDFCKWVG